MEYEDIVSTQIDVAFEIVELPIAELVGAHAVIWTTTPWTIPVNQAIAYGADVEYALFEITVNCANQRAMPCWCTDLLPHFQACCRKLANIRCRRRLLNARFGAFGTFLVY